MTNGTANTNLVGSLTWAGVESRLDTGASAILPVGAAAKEHGTHLPMNTDEIQALWIAQQLAANFDLLIWPTLTYGHYPAFTEFPGSISLSRLAFMGMVTDIIDGITRWKPKALFVLDTGISTIEPIAAAIAAQEWPVPVLHLRIHEGPRYCATVQTLSEQAFGSHADEMETSRMLAIAPGVVDMAKAEATPAGPIAGPLTRATAPSGSYGDPTPATAAKGRALWQAMLDDLGETMKRTFGAG